jgi:hypothetical protein
MGVGERRSVPGRSSRRDTSSSTATPSDGSVVGETEWAIDGYGLRDRSWGPRFWQAPDHYRWLTMNFGATAGIAAARTVQRDGRAVEGGYIYREGEPNRYVGKVEVETEVAGDERLHASLRARVHPIDGGSARGDHRARPRDGLPLRNRRNGRDHAHREGLTEWRWGDRVGYGWSEYLDHVGLSWQRASRRGWARARCPVAIEDVKRLRAGRRCELWRFTLVRPGATPERLVLRRDPPGHVIEVEPQARVRHDPSGRRGRRAGAEAPRVWRDDPVLGTVVLRHGFRRG